MLVTPRMDRCKAVLSAEVTGKGGVIQQLVATRDPQWGVIWRADFLAPAPAGPSKAFPIATSTPMRFLCWSELPTGNARPNFLMVRLGNGLQRLKATR